MIVELVLVPMLQVAGCAGAGAGGTGASSGMGAAALQWQPIH